MAAHQHLISPAFAKLVDASPLDGQMLVRQLDQAGIDRGVVLSMGYSFGDERKNVPLPDEATALENDWTSREVQRSNGRLVGFCSVNPLRAKAMAEVDRCLRLPGIVGLKLHFGNSGVSLRDPAKLGAMQRMFALVDRRGGAIVVHLCSRTGVPYGREDARLFLDSLLPYAPNSVVQIAHLAGAGPGFPDLAQEAMAVFAEAVAKDDSRTRNLWFDLATVTSDASTIQDGRLVATVIRHVGPARIVFGSDMTIGENPAPLPAWLIFQRQVPLTASERRRIARNVPPYMRSLPAR